MRLARQALEPPRRVARDGQDGMDDEMRRQIEADQRRTEAVDEKRHVVIDGLHDRAAADGGDADLGLARAPFAQERPHRHGGVEQRRDGPFGKILGGDVAVEMTKERLVRPGFGFFRRRDQTVDQRELVPFLTERHGFSGL